MGWPTKLPEVDRVNSPSNIKANPAYAWPHVRDSLGRPTSQAEFDNYDIFSKYRNALLCQKKKKKPRRKQMLIELGPLPKAVCRDLEV